MRLCRTGYPYRPGPFASLLTDCCQVPLAPIPIESLLGNLSTEGLAKCAEPYVVTAGP